MRLRSAGLLFVFCAICRAQTEPVAFEVASVKLQPWRDNGSVGVFIKGNTLDAEHADLNTLVEFAYNLQDFQLSGGPAWGTHGKLDNSELFQVLAKPADGQTPTEDQFRLMLQTLLADRFHLQVHHVSKQLPAWNLVAAKGGPKLKESPVDAEPHMAISSNIRIVATGKSVQNLIDSQLSIASGRPVFDKTGLTGNYDFTLEWVNRKLSAASDPGLADGLSLFTALQEQLGLKLESTTAPFDTIVIDHAEKPSEN
jgi:uncharacterized protein (TIGR03435 family)